MNAALTSAPTTARRNASTKHRWRIFLILAALFCAVGSYAAAAPPQPPPDAPQSTTPDYLIGAGDLLQIFVWKNPELSNEIPVRPDGWITTPLVKKDIRAVGRRPTELAEDLRTALAEYIQDPQVTVVVKSFAASNAVRVMGSVETPKSVPYRSGLTALDALIDAGGLKETANGNGAKLIRVEKGEYKTYPLRLKSLVRSGDARANVKLMPGDIIQVPEKWF